MSKDNSRLIKTICISGSSAVISYLINFFLTSFISENVGIEAYSFVSIAKTAVSYAQIITVALTTFIVRYISINYHQKQMEKARAYYSSSIVACVLLSGGIYLVILALLPRLEYIINIPDNLIYPVKILFLLVFFNFILTTLITPLNSGAFIKNRLDISGILKIISYLTDAGVLILVFSIATPSIWVVGLGSVTASLVLATGTFIMKQKLVPELKFEKKLVSFRCVKDMMSNGIWQSVNSLGNVLNSGLDLIVSNLMLSGTETGQIAVVKTIGTMFSMLYQVVNQPFQPKMLKVYSTGDKKAFFKELTKTMKMCGFFSNVAFAGFVALGWTYFKLWLPSQNTDVLYVLGVITVFGSITEGVAQPLYYVNTLTLKKKIPCFVTVGSGLLNTLSMYLLLKYTDWGVYVIVLTTAVIMTCVNFFFNPIYCAKCLKLHPLSLYPVIGRHILSVVIMIGIFKAMTLAYMPSSWITLIAYAMLMCVAGFFVHVIVMTNMSEKHRIKVQIVKMINKNAK